MLANVAAELAEGVAAGLGMEVPDPMPKAADVRVKPEVDVSPALSLLSRPGDGGIQTRRVAILVADGVDGNAVSAMHTALLERGAVPRLVGARLGEVTGADGDTFAVEATMETTPSVLYDALFIPGGKKAVDMLGTLGHAAEFIKDQYRHAKAICALGAATALVENAGVPPRLPSGEADPGLLLLKDDDCAAAIDVFVQAIARHRHHAREMDPPRV
jgi:catalase